MSDPAPLDLAKLDAWYGCKPGMTRVQVQAALQAAGADVTEDGDDLTASAGDCEIEISFSKDGTERVRQILVDADVVTSAGKPLKGLRLDDALRTIAPTGATVWSLGDTPADTLPEPSAGEIIPPTDEQCLRDGTVWIPERGLGLMLWNGALMFVVWRGAQDLPKQFAGPVTRAQRELSQRSDLERHLRDKATAQTIATWPKDPMRFFRWALTLATAAVLALTAREGLREKTRWDAAPSVKGKLAAFEKGPSKQFFEYLPAPVTQHLPKWLLAGKLSGERPQVDLYRIDYAEPNGQLCEVRLEGAEFYVPPAQIGDEADLTYLDGTPPRVKGPARAQNAAFIEHVPWAISIGLLWLATSLALTAVPFLLRLLGPLAEKIVASNSSIVTDRPDLR